MPTYIPHSCSYASVVQTWEGWVKSRYSFWEFKSYCICNTTLLLVAHSKFWTEWSPTRKFSLSAQESDSCRWTRQRQGSFNGCSSWCSWRQSRPSHCWSPALPWSPWTQRQSWGGSTAVEWASYSLPPRRTDAFPSQRSSEWASTTWNSRLTQEDVTDWCTQALGIWVPLPSRDLLN